MSIYNFYQTYYSIQRAVRDIMITGENDPLGPKDISSDHHKSKWYGYSENISKLQWYYIYLT